MRLLLTILLTLTLTGCATANKDLWEKQSKINQLGHEVDKDHIQMIKELHNLLMDHKYLEHPY